jgi:anaerobic ribonucleoside-triphosphate reductase
MLEPDNSFLFPEDTMAELTVPKLMFRRIQKRDGTIVDFDKTKISQAIFAAAQSVGGKDAELADSLTDRVILYLARTEQDGLLNVELVQDAIEKVLIENGHARTAKSFILYRAERHRIRQTKQVQSIRNKGHETKNFIPSPSSLVPSLQVRTSDEQVVAWNRQRIIDALVRETQLYPETATQISKEVELQIIESKLRIITAGLIRELVNAKLLEHGFQKEQRLHTRLGIPLYDYEQLLLSLGTNPTPPEAKPAKPIERILTESFSKQYALAKVFAQEIVNAHAEGTLYLHGLDEIANGYLLRYNSGFSTANTFNPQILNLKSEFNLVVSESDLTLPAIDTIIETSKDTELKIRFIKKPEAFPTPELVMHKISLNLPRFAYMVSSIDRNLQPEETESYLFQLFKPQLELIAQAHLQKQNLINRIYGDYLLDRIRQLISTDVEPTLVYTIGITGLNDLVQSFSGEQLHQSESALRLGIRILSELQGFCRQLSRTFNIPLALEPTYNPEVASRFAKLDLARFQLLANQVVKKKPTNGGGSYTLGANFAAESNLDIFDRIEAETRLHPYLNNQAYISIPKAYLDAGIAQSGKEWLLSFLKRVLSVVGCQLLVVSLKTEN